MNENVYKLVGPVDASTNKEDGETQSAVSSDEWEALVSTWIMRCKQMHLVAFNYCHCKLVFGSCFYWDGKWKTVVRTIYVHCAYAIPFRLNHIDAYAFNSKQNQLFIVTFRLNESK